MPWPATRRLIGTKVPRVDGIDKSTGRAKYSFDVNRPRMIHAKILRSPHAHATIRTIDTAAAEKVNGFLTAVSEEYRFALLLDLVDPWAALGASELMLRTLKGVTGLQHNPEQPQMNAENADQNN